MPEYTDHFLSKWHLTRLDSYGRGAGARFHIDAPGQRFSWADLTYVEVSGPHRLVAVGRGGKFNRNKLWWEWRLDPAHGHGTKVTLTAEIAGALPTDRFMQGALYRGWFKRKAKKALDRLQSILEEDRGRGTRATVAGVSAPVGAADH
jgi:uncharacterized protein YndB with AHSA1/START domain